MIPADAPPFVPQPDAGPELCTVLPSITDTPTEGAQGNSSVFRLAAVDPEPAKLLWNFAVGPTEGPELIQFLRSNGWRPTP